MRRERPGVAQAGVSYVLLTALGATMLLPFLWMLATSLKSEAEIFQKRAMPQSVTLPAEGSAVTTSDGRPIRVAEPVLGADGKQAVAADGKPRWQPGEPLTVHAGSPLLRGSPGDRAESGSGEGLSDDLGTPVTNGMLMNDPTVIARFGGVTRFRTGKIPRMKGVVLIPRGDAANEAMARAWFSRYDATWDEMVAARWHGQVPLMLSEAMRRDWATRSGKGEAVTAGGHEVLKPGSQEPYQYRDCSWNEVGEPVRDALIPTEIVDSHGRPIVYNPPFPMLKTEDDPLKGRDGSDLMVFVGDEQDARAVRGSELALDRSVRLLFSNYLTVLADPEIRMSLYAWNSLFVSVSVVLLQVLTSSLAAFAFARLEWPGRDKIFIAYLATLMIPGVVTQIPNYLILQKLGWLNTFWCLIVPAASTAFGTFMLRQFMLTLPKGIEEAARIDGASLLRVWWDIVLPMSKPAVITLAIFAFVGTWQSFTWPLIVAPDEAVRVMPVALQQFQSSRGTSYNLLMGGALLMMLPMVFLFIIGQKYFVKGINLGAVKG